MNAPITADYTLEESQEAIHSTYHALAEMAVVVQAFQQPGLNARASTNLSNLLVVAADLANDMLGDLCDATGWNHEGDGTDADGRPRLVVEGGGS